MQYSRGSYLVVHESIEIFTDLVLLVWRHLIPSCSCFHSLFDYTWSYGLYTYFSLVLGQVTNSDGTIHFSELLIHATFGIYSLNRTPSHQSYLRISGRPSVRPNQPARSILKTRRKQKIKQTSPYTPPKCQEK